MSSGHNFRPVNGLLGAKASIGPIPADLFIPFAAISLLIFVVTYQFLRLPLNWVIALVIWGCSTWWILTGSRPYRFLSKFIRPPNRWSRGYIRYRGSPNARRRRTL